MTAKSLRRFVGVTISADDLFERYKAACDLKRHVDHEKITLALRAWADRIGIADVAIMFITTGKEVEEAARAASAEWDAWDASATWDISYLSIIAIGAS